MAEPAVRFQTFVGVDLHKRSVTLAAVDPRGQLVARLQMMHLRKLGRHWHRLTRTLARAKAGMRSIVDAANLRGPKFDGVRAQKWLLAHGHRLKEVDRLAFGDLVALVQTLERQREPLRWQMAAAMKQERFAVQAALLKSVPGIDEVWACIIAAEVGPFDRFPNANALEFWAGLTADNKESAGITRSGPITKAGSATLRWALGMAALTLCRSDAGQEAVRQRLVKRRGKAIANVAMARRLLRTLYAMMRDGTMYERGEPSTFTTKLIERNHRRKLAAPAA